MSDYPKIPKPPQFLIGEGKSKFIEIAQMLIDEGKWKQGDDIALASLCANYQRWIQAEKAIRKNKDLCFVTESGYRQQIPEIAIANNAMKSMLAFIKEFSLTPKERAKLKSLLLKGGDGEGSGDGEKNDPELEGMIVK
jgi:P27 family predicted phage terminase small subunit